MFEGFLFPCDSDLILTSHDLYGRLILFFLICRDSSNVSMNIKNNVKIKIKITRDSVVQLMWLTSRVKGYMLLLAFLVEEEMRQKEENNPKTLEC